MTTLESVTLITAITGAVGGAIGAVLGIFNTWSQWSRNRVRLRVVPKIAFHAEDRGIYCDHMPLEDERYLFNYPARLCIEVKNLSSFPVTISDVGFGDYRKLRHCIVLTETSPRRSTACAARPPK